MLEPRNYRTDPGACNDRVARPSAVELSPRLAAVAAFVPPGSIVADIGSGHGLLARSLVRRGRGAAARVIATDISLEEPVARRHADPGLPVEYRIGDGLDVLRPADGIDVLVIAGMGARSMLAILERGLAPLPGVRRLVLQPQTDAAAVRQGLLQLGWGRIRERLVRDRGRFYNVLAAESGEARADPPPPLTPDDLLQAGADLLGSPTDAVREYWERQASRWQRIVERRATAEGLSRLEQARRILAFLPPRSTGNRPFGMMPAVRST